MSNISNSNWSENLNGAKLGNPPPPRQASLTNNPSNSNMMPPTPGSTGPHHPMPPHFADYSRNVPVPGPGAPPFPLQQNQRSYLPNTAYTVQPGRDKLQPGQPPLPQQQQQQQQQSQQPMYHQYPPQPMGYLAGEMYNNPQQQQEYQQINHLQNQQYNLQQRQQQQQEQGQVPNRKTKQTQQLSPQQQPHPQPGAPIHMQQYPVGNEYNAAYQQNQHPGHIAPDHHQQQQQQQQHQGQVPPPPQHWEGYPPQPPHGPVDSQIPQPGQLQQQQQQQLQQQQSRQFPPVVQPPQEEKKRGRKPKSRKSSETGLNIPHQLGGQVRATSIGSGKPVTKRSRMGCLTCRQRKKRCCETRPKCTECARLRLNCVWPKPGTEHKNKPKDQKEDENTIEHAEFGRIKVLRGIVEYRSK